MYIQTARDTYACVHEHEYVCECCACVHQTLSSPRKTNLHSTHSNKEPLFLPPFFALFLSALSLSLHSPSGPTHTLHTNTNTHTHTHTGRATRSWCAVIREERFKSNNPATAFPACVYVCVWELYTQDMIYTFAALLSRIRQMCQKQMQYIRTAYFANVCIIYNILETAQLKCKTSVVCIYVFCSGLCVCVCVRACVHMRTCIYIHVHTRAHEHTCTHTRTRTKIHQTHIHPLAYANTHTHTNVHAHTHTHTHTHTHRHTHKHT